MITDLAIARKDILINYYPYNFIRELGREQMFAILLKEITTANNNQKEIQVKGHNHIFIYDHLKWESDFYKIPNYKLKFILFEHSQIKILTEAIDVFIKELIIDKEYCYIDIPSEDIFLIQALCMNGFRLIETRLNHYLDNLNDYKQPRYKVRNAVVEDILTLREVASKNRNIYDRLHADIIFDDILADNYLATFAENAVKGFCDKVIVPDEHDINSKAFMAFSLLDEKQTELPFKMGKYRLSAIDPECKGWYIKLASEAIYSSINFGAKYILTNTQTTTKAGIRSNEKLGFKFGSATHVLSKSKIF